MTNFPFAVDNEYAKTHNEFFRDAKRLQISAAILAAILVGVIVVVFMVKGVAFVSVAIAISFGFLAVLSLAMIPILPKKMGSPAEYYAAYQLVPAMIATVRPRDLEVLALVNASSSPDTVVPALALRTVSSIPNAPREVGARVPSVAVTGTLRFKSSNYEEISPMPIAWGTKDLAVVKQAEAAVADSQWKKLEGLLDRVDDVRATKRNLLIL